MSDDSKKKLCGKKTLKVNSFLNEFEKDEIKRRVDIVKLLESYGVKLTKKGKNYIGLCPFHNDKEPSLSVMREQGLCNCFSSACTFEGGDQFNVVQAFEKCDFKEALSILKKWCGNGSSHGSTHSIKKIEKILSPVKKSEEEPAKKPESLKQDELQQETEEKNEPEKEQLKQTISLKVVAEYYHKKLYGHKEALSYLKKRGLDNLKLYKKLMLGYSDGSLPAKLSDNQKKQLTDLGIIKRNERTGSLYEHLHACITFPQFDEDGLIVGFYGRKIDKLSCHLFLAGEHKGLINHKAPFVYSDNIILTESPIDSMSLMQGGIENTIPCYGTGGFTKDHLKTLKDARVKTVTIAFDNDDGGNKGSYKLKEKLLEKGFRVKQVFPEGVKDWNEYLVKKHSFEDLKKLIEEAEVFNPEEKEETFTVTKKHGVYIFKREAVTYRVLGVKEVWVSNLKVNIKVDIKDSTYPDNVDLYSARSRTLFSQNISRIFGLEEKRIENDLLEMLNLLEKERDAFLSGQTCERPNLTEDEKRTGMEFLKSTNLFNQIISDTEILGYVGDELNKLLMYICASSRLMDDPISIILISQSSAGKSYLIDTIKKLMPDEQVISMTSLSDQALNYLPEGGLLNKFLVMGEAVHSEIIEHQVREMLSSKELSRLVTTKDEKTGKLVSRNVKTKVVVASVMSTTKWDINSENASRVFLLSSDESVEQTKKIHKSQRQKYSLKRYHEKRNLIPEIVKKHKAAQRLLESRIIVNPFGQALDFPDSLMRCRRDHERFIDLIACICFLRQFQKKEKQEKEAGEDFSYIECDLEDYRVAHRILKGILPATLTSFPKSAIGLYEEIRQLVTKKAKRENLKTKEVAVTQREIREHTGHNQMFVKRYVKILLEYEYLKTASSSGRGTRNTYYLVEDEAIQLIDLSRIPTPEEMEKKLENHRKDKKKDE